MDGKKKSDSWEIHIFVLSHVRAEKESTNFSPSGMKGVIRFQFSSKCKEYPEAQGHFTHRRLRLISYNCSCLKVVF